MSCLFDMIRAMKEGFIRDSESFRTLLRMNEGNDSQMFRILIHGNDLMNAEEFEDAIEKADKLIAVCAVVKYCMYET